jgi:hypothetical protein
MGGTFVEDIVCTRLGLPTPPLPLLALLSGRQPKAGSQCPPPRAGLQALIMGDSSRGSNVLDSPPSAIHHRRRSLLGPRLLLPHVLPPIHRPSSSDSPLQSPSPQLEAPPADRRRGGDGAMRGHEQGTSTCSASFRRPPRLPHPAPSARCSSPTPSSSFGTRTCSISCPLTRPPGPALAKEAADWGKEMRRGLGRSGLGYFRSRFSPTPPTHILAMAGEPPTLYPATKIQSPRTATPCLSTGRKGKVKRKRPNCPYGGNRTTSGTTAAPLASQPHGNDTYHQSPTTGTRAKQAHTSAAGVGSEDAHSTLQETNGADHVSRSQIPIGWSGVLDL